MTNDNKSFAAKSIHKHQQGQSISDAELLNAIQFLNDVTMSLKYLGERYHLPYKELNRILQQFEEFQESRSTYGIKLP